MTIRRLGVGALVVTAMLLHTGCIVIDGHWGGHRTVWTEEVTEKIPIDAAGMKRIKVETHNGAIGFTGEIGDAYVTVRKKAGGHCSADAEAALEALDVYVKSAGTGTCTIGYRWKGMKKSAWHASVGFDIHAPAELNLTGVTHNGGVNIAGLSGDLKIETHNGGVRAATTGERMVLRTHNGAINARFSGTRVHMETHNGPITADLTECGPVEGKITTHNGGVEVLVGSGTSLSLDCHSHNGRIRCTAPLQSVEATRLSLHGTIGDGGGGRLAVETHNGSVEVKADAG